MTTGCKKLPCNHIFHTSCLRSWFQRQQTCPTCRMDVLRPQPPPQPQQPPPPQAPQPPFGFHPMGVPPPPMGIPPTPGVQPQGLQNGKNLLEMRLICACKNFMVVFCKTCILLPLTDFLLLLYFLLYVPDVCSTCLIEHPNYKNCTGWIILTGFVNLLHINHCICSNLSLRSGICIYMALLSKVFRLIVQAHSHFIFSTHPLLTPQLLRSDC